MTTGERIKARRKQLAISADTLAEKIGVSRSTVFRWEKGEIEKVPAIELNTIASVLQTTAEYLIGIVDDPEQRFVSESSHKSEAENQPGAVKIRSLANQYPDMTPEMQTYVDGYMDSLFLILRDKFPKKGSVDNEP